VPDQCRVLIVFDQGPPAYAFPHPHPFSRSRVEVFRTLISEPSLAHKFQFQETVAASEREIESFHDKDYVDLVKKASKLGIGYLDKGDTPAYKGIYEASVTVAGSTLLALSKVVSGEFDHAFVPVGGLHHAARDRAGGFCVFNDAAIAICKARTDYGIRRILYVDIDAHHGDGVFYEFVDDPDLWIADVHEDGRFLYPGTGSAEETGEGAARGSKLNFPLPPSSGDSELLNCLPKIRDHGEKCKPELILLQCGADGLEGDPITHLRYSPKAHRMTTVLLHEMAHELCKGRIIALGGGGYDARNVGEAWLEVAKALASSLEHR
jgi:acetoin utilization protein AcuC